MLLWLIISGFVLSGLLPWVFARRDKWLTVFSCLIPSGLFGVFFFLLQKYAGQFPVLQRTEWGARAGVDLVFRWDALSATLSLLITLLGAGIFRYAAAYFANAADRRKFYGLALFFLSAMLGTVLSENLIVLFVFWELTGAASYFLIAFDSSREKSRASALTALLVTNLGGLLMLGGFLVLGRATGSYELTEIFSNSAFLRDDPYFTWALILILAGAFTKSAQFPFHFWLPGAMVAPTPISAYLHSATMVKLGVFLLLRLSPVLCLHPLWGKILPAVGFATFLGASYLGFVTHDFKRLLAYTTVASLGLMTALAGMIDSPESSVAAVVLTYLVAHAFYKGALFLLNGNYDKLLKERDIRKISGAATMLPLSSLVSLVALFSFAGLPPFPGFIAKELALETVLSEPIFLAILVLGNALGFATALRIGKTLRGRRTEAKPESAGLLLPNLVFTAAMLGISFVPMAGLGLPTFHWAQGTPLNLTLFSLALGSLFFLCNRWVEKVKNSDEPFGFVLFQSALKIVIEFGRWQYRLFQSGKLRQDVALTALFFFFIFILGWEHIDGNSLLTAAVDPIPLGAAICGSLMLFSALICLRTRSRIVAVMALGGVGYGTAVFYSIFGMPDLAMTQIAVETLSVVLFVLALKKIPSMEKTTRGFPRSFQIMLALTLGGALSLLTWTAMAHRVSSRLSPFFAKSALPDAHGRNIVNVILVDFRGFDTFGEISVLAIAALGVWALLKSPRAEKSN